MGSPWKSSSSWFSYLALTLLVLLAVPSLRGGKRPSQVLWSYGSRVYAAFIAITVLSLLLFSFFSQSFFSRVFAQRFIESAEVHANFARNIMQDFIFLQQEEGSTLIAPTDDLVLWISSAIANDVNLYREGRLASSSRRELYDWGLLPELVDGEIYFRLSYENKPFYALRQSIGRYSYQLLAIPYSVRQTPFLISLPFPSKSRRSPGHRRAGRVPGLHFGVLRRPRPHPGQGHGPDDHHARQQARRRNAGGRPGQPGYRHRTPLPGRDEDAGRWI